MYLFLDAETGGLDPDNNSLLTIAFLAVEKESLEYVNSLSLALKPDDGIYKLTAQGMAVNKINIVEHDKEAITYKEGKKELRNFLYNLGSKDKPIPVGWNMTFDMEFIFTILLDKDAWENYVSYRKIDLCSVCYFLNSLGLAESGSLEKVAQRYGIETKGNHNAMFDTLLTLEVFKKVQSNLSLIKGRSG